MRHRNSQADRGAQSVDVRGDSSLWKSGATNAARCCNHGNKDKPIDANRTFITGTDTLTIYFWRVT